MTDWESKTIRPRHWLGCENEDLSDFFARAGEGSDPFPHVHCDRFFASDALEYIVDVANAMPLEAFGRHPSGYTFGVFPSKSFLRFVHSPELAALVSRLHGRPMRVARRYPAAQIYEFAAMKKGLVPHTDDDRTRDLGLIVYLNEGWTERDEGRLVLFEKSGNELRPRRWFAPLQNSMVGLHVSPVSWHGVEPLAGRWRRRTLVVDFERVPAASVHTLDRAG